MFPHLPQEKVTQQELSVEVHPLCQGRPESERERKARQGRNHPSAAVLEIATSWRYWLPRVGVQQTQEHLPCSWPDQGPLNTSGTDTTEASSSSAFRGSWREQPLEWQGVGTLGSLKCYGSIKEGQRHCSLMVLTKQTRFAPVQPALQAKDKRCGEQWFSLKTLCKFCKGKQNISIKVCRKGLAVEGTQWLLFQKAQAQFLVPT